MKVDPPRVLAWRCPAPHRHRQAAVAAFEAPEGMEQAGSHMARIYAAALSAGATFGRVVLSGSDGDPDRFLPSGTDLLVRGKVERLIVGSGALSEQVKVQVWVTDVGTDTVLWWVEQSASSMPRPDLNLFWNVVPGGGAAPYGKLTRALANQFVDLLSDAEAQRRGCFNLDRK
ncbi:hypothetical protein SAMN02746041_00687 [Desulfacinum hydrothermale DSM 13146]|uniref:Uncharacterized protein n=1 Tax=Desulfacinum hydrothermale DSM 13146 TaxID=1121390 RepID=A0A1W1X6L5_9BACT|nr:hypothetical protein SAMN02746041_00687 [Desulfacinum hydrothermale DSM 13146]